MSTTESHDKEANVDDIAGMLSATEQDLQSHLGMPISDLRALGFEVYEEQTPGIRDNAGSPGLMIATRKKTAAERAEELSIEFNQSIPIEHMDSQQYTKFRLGNLLFWVRCEARIRIIKALRDYIKGEAKKMESFHSEYVASGIAVKE